MVALREQIMKKAFQAMNVQGTKFTMDDLTKELGVSKRTLYEYFKSKEDIIAAVLDTTFADLENQLEEILRNHELAIIPRLTALIIASPKNLGPINERVIDDIERYMPKEWAKIEAFQEKKWTMIEEVINQGVKQGLFRPVSMAILHRMFIGATNELLDWQFLKENDVTFTNALTKMAEMMIFGLSAANNIE